MKEIPPKEYNILFLGDPGIGAKTSLILRLSEGLFKVDPLLTIGMEFRTKLINLKSGNKIKLRMWDAAGQDKFRNIVKNYYKGIHYFIFGYDVTDKNSFDIIRNWFKDVSNSSNKPRGYLIGNKIDLFDKRKVSEEEGRELAYKLKMKFFEKIL